MKKELFPTISPRDFTAVIRQACLVRNKVREQIAERIRALEGEKPPYTKEELQQSGLTWPRNVFRSPEIFLKITRSKLLPS